MNEVLDKISLAKSPNLWIPDAVTLPYTYEPISRNPLQYIEHVDEDQVEIIRNHAQQCMEKVQTELDNANRLIANWKGRMQSEKLQTLRRTAPGYLDVDPQARLLVPQRPDATNESPDPNSTPSKSIQDSLLGLSITNDHI